MYYLQIDMDPGASTGALCDVCHYCHISTVVLMCNTNSPHTSAHVDFGLAITVTNTI